MKTMNWTADNVQESKSETLENKATYRAPRLVALGTAEDLVQAFIVGNVWDAFPNASRDRKYRES
jgi:hypothetical protein